MVVCALSVTTASTETLNGTILGVTSTQHLTMTILYTNKLDTPIYVPAPRGVICLVFMRSVQWLLACFVPCQRA